MPSPFFATRQFGQGFAVLGQAGLLITPLFVSLELGSRGGLRFGVAISALLSFLAAIIGGLIVGGWRKAAQNIVRGCIVGFGVVTIVFFIAFLENGFPHSTNVAWKIFCVSVAVTTCSAVLLAIGYRKWSWTHDAI
jgi:hypothetical protein